MRNEHRAKKNDDVLLWLTVHETARANEIFVFLWGEKTLNVFFILSYLCWRNESWDCLHYHIQYKLYKSTIEYYLNNNAHIFFRP